MHILQKWLKDLSRVMKIKIQKVIMLSTNIKFRLNLFHYKPQIKPDQALLYFKYTFRSFISTELGFYCGFK